MVDHIDSLPAFLVYGVGGLAVALALLFTWLRMRMPRTDPGAAGGATAGGGAPLNPR